MVGQTKVRATKYANKKYDVHQWSIISNANAVICDGNPTHLCPQVCAEPTFGQSSGLYPQCPLPSVTGNCIPSSQAKTLACCKTGWGELLQLGLQVKGPHLYWRGSRTSVSNFKEWYTCLCCALGCKFSFRSLLIHPVLWPPVIET